MLSNTYGEAALRERTCREHRDITDRVDSHRSLCKWQRQSGNSVRAKERDDGRFFLSLSTCTALERDGLTLRITLPLARANRFQAGLSTLSVISLWSWVVSTLQDRLFWRQGPAWRWKKKFRRFRIGCITCWRLVLNARRTDRIIGNDSTSHFETP